MLKYFDILLIRIYNQYISWGEKDIPKLTSMLVLSLFQSMNVLAIMFLIRSLIENKPWYFPKFYIVITMVLVLLMDYIRVFRIIGFDKLLQRYNEPFQRKVFLHPVLYFVLSISLLILLRFFNLFPHAVT